MKKTIAVAFLTALFAVASMPSHAFKIGSLETGNLRVCAENNEVRATLFGKDGKLIPQPKVGEKYVKDGKTYADVNFYLLLTIVKEVPVVNCKKAASRTVSLNIEPHITQTIAARVAEPATGRSLVNLNGTTRSLSRAAVPADKKHQPKAKSKKQDKKTKAGSTRYGEEEEMDGRPRGGASSAEQKDKETKVGSVRPGEEVEPDGRPKTGGATH